MRNTFTRRVLRTSARFSVALFRVKFGSFTIFVAELDTRALPCFDAGAALCRALAPV